MHVDNKTIKMAVKNVFNITNLTSSDAGGYTCKVCDQSRGPEYIKIGKKGNICQLLTWNEGYSTKNTPRNEINFKQVRPKGIF